MDPGGSVTRCMHEVRAGNGDSAQLLWQRYFDKLRTLARARLKNASRRVSDEEDAALSAMDSLCRGLQEGRFPKLNDREDLWQLLVVITTRKAINQVNRERRQRRGGGDVRGESVFYSLRDGAGVRGIEQIVGRDPTPEFAVMCVEQYERLLHSLGDETLRRVAVWKMEGYTREEIAERLECKPRTVTRKLALIRQILESQRD